MLPKPLIQRLPLIVNWFLLLRLEEIQIELKKPLRLMEQIYSELQTLYTPVSAATIGANVAISVVISIPYPTFSFLDITAKFC
ncbi:hypothetical protein ACQBEH_05840 [Brevibacillus laterosporus]